MLSKKIKEIILLKFPNSEIYVKTFDEVHFEIVVVDNFFINVELLDRHMKIYNIISHYILNKIIHAVSIKIYTFDEWNKYLNL